MVITFIVKTKQKNNDEKRYLTTLLPFILNKVRNQLVP